MGGRHGSTHYHTATLQMASITVECAELAVGALGGKMSNVHHPAANSTVNHSFTHDHYVHPLPCKLPWKNGGEKVTRTNQFLISNFSWKCFVSDHSALSVVILFRRWGAGCAKLLWKLKQHSKGLSVSFPGLVTLFPLTNWLGGTEQ